MQPLSHTPAVFSWRSSWRFTNNYSSPELKHKAYLLMLNHFEEVAATSEEFLLLSVQELVKIIEDDRLSVKKEKKVFEAVLRGIAYAPMQRREFVSAFVQCKWGTVTQLPLRSLFFCIFYIFAKSVIVNTTAWTGLSKICNTSKNRWL